jgi:ABC-2 type transport system permease protein
MSPLHTIARLELKRSFRDRAVAALIVVFALLAAYAVHGGARWASTRAATIATAVNEADETMALRRADFVMKVAAGEKPAFGLIYATALPFRAGLPNAPLAALSVGQAETYPAAAVIQPFIDPATIFDRFRTGLESPAVLNAGRFDLAFVIVFLLPLLLLAGTYDLWARDRESGSARLQLAQPVRPLALLALRAGIRGGVLLLPMTVIATLLLGLSSSRDPLGLAGFAVVVLVYGAFWVLLALAVNVFARTSTAAALACGTAWLVIVLLLPALAATTTYLLAPSPSALKYTNDVRAEGLAVRARNLAAASAAASRAAVTSAEHAYPELLWNQRREIGERDARLAPIHAAFSRAHTARRTAGNAARFVSPAVVAQDALDRLAGTDADRAVAFQTQATTFAAATRALAFDWMDRDRLMTLADYDGGLPRFTFVERSSGQMLALDLVAISACCALAFAIAALGLRRRGFIGS